MRLTASDAVDLDAVDELCRLALSAGRLGCRVRLFDVDPGLRDLIVLAGVDGILLHEPLNPDPTNDDRDDQPQEADLP
jgi:hypothetical protein